MSRGLKYIVWMGTALAINSYCTFWDGSLKFIAAIAPTDLPCVYSKIWSLTQLLLSQCALLHKFSYIVEIGCCDGVSAVWRKYGAKTYNHWAPCRLWVNISTLQCLSVRARSAVTSIPGMTRHQWVALANRKNMKNNRKKPINLVPKSAREPEKKIFGRNRPSANKNKKE